MPHCTLPHQFIWYVSCVGYSIQVNGSRFHLFVSGCVCKLGERIIYFVLIETLSGLYGWLVVVFRNDDDGSIAPWSASRQTLSTPHMWALATWAWACHRWVHFCHYFCVWKVQMCPLFKAFWQQSGTNSSQLWFAVKMKLNLQRGWWLFFFRWTLFRPRWNRKVAMHTEGLRVPSCNGECCFVLPGLMCAWSRHRNVASVRSAAPDCENAVCFSGLISKWIQVQYMQERLPQSQRWMTT